MQDPNLASLLSVYCNSTTNERTRFIVFRIIMVVTWAQLGMKPTAKQVQACWFYVSTLPELVWVWSRGASKTFCGTFCILFIAITEVADLGWVAATHQQLARFILYVYRFQNRTWMGAYISTGHVAGEMFVFAMAITMTPTDDPSAILIVLKNTSGGRAATLHKDEEGKIKKVDVARSFEEADGMHSGARGIIRDRHTSTLANGTPIMEAYEACEPLGLVIKIHYTECPWIDQDHVARLRKRRADWWMHLEYDNIPDAPGGRIIKAFQIVQSYPPGCEIKRGGIDWNPSWGHSGIIRVSNGVRDWIIDEIRTTDLDLLAKWIYKWEQLGFLFVAEAQGGKTMNQSPALRKIRMYLLHDGTILTEMEWLKAGRPSFNARAPQYVRIAGEELWNDDIQKARTSEIDAFSRDETHINVLAGLTNCVGQFPAWHYDDEDPDGLPASKQRDHHCDAYAHSRGGVMLRFG